MGKNLKTTPAELDALFGFTNIIPPEKVSEAIKFSNFRRAIKIALKPYNDGINAFLDVLKEDAKKFNEDKSKKENELKDAKKEDKKKLEKEIADLVKALKDLDIDFQERLKKYQEEHKDLIEVKFNEEDLCYMTELFSTTAKDLFKFSVKDKTGKDIELFDSNRVDALFELLAKAE